MLKVWLLSVVALNLCVLSTVIPFWRSEEVQKTVRGTVFPTNAAYAPMPNLKANFLQLLSHPGATIAAQAETRLLLNMRQNDHVRALPPAGGAAAERPQTTRADVHHMTETVNRKGLFVVFDEPEPHGFWLAKNTVVGSTGQRNIFDLRCSERTHDGTNRSPRLIARAEG
jgi:hypothetical protein